MLNFLFTSRKVGVRSKPPKNNRIGIVSPGIAYGLLVVTHDTDSINDVPRTGAPSMISNLVIVSDSLYWFGGAPVVSRRIMDNSMCLILMRTSKK